MKRDKKVRQGRIAFVLLSGPGQIVTSADGACTVQIPEATLLETVRDFRKI
jgi:3-dehydroquinate synthetase